MSNETIETQIANLRESDAYNDEHHEDHQMAKDQMKSLHEDLHGTGPSSELSPLDKLMAEALDPDFKERDPEARFDNEIVYGEPKWGEPMKRDEFGKEVTILERPDLYKLEPNSIITREDIIEHGDEEDFHKEMKKIQPNWTPEDMDLKDALEAYAVKEGLGNEAIDEIFNTFVRSPDYGKAYTQDEGFDGLVRYCDGDVDLAESLAHKAINVVENMPDGLKRAIIEDTSLGNNPTFIALVAGLDQSHMGSAVDDFSHSINPYEEE